jgi:hypothetical protein
MRNRIVMLFAVFIVIYIAIHIASQSAVFSTYPETLNTAPVNPPIVLQDPGVSGVSVSLGVAGTSANITVLLPYSLVISRDAIYYTTFDSGVPAGWAGSTCWGGSTTAWVGGSITCSAAGAYEVAYYNSSIVSNTMPNIHIGAYVMSNNLGADTYVGIVLYNRTTGEYYFAAVGNGSRLNILRCTGGTCTLVASTSNLGLQPNTWYFLYALWTSRTSWHEGGLSAYLYRTDTGEQIGYTFFTEAIFIDFDTVGIAAYNTQTWIDELAISSASTLAVSFSGVLSGWVVKIYNDTVLVNQGVSPGLLFVIYIFYGTANSHNSTILRSGRVEVYDSYGNLRASRSEVIVTGRDYLLQGTGGSFNNRVLNVVNVDLKGYYGMLILRAPPSYFGFSTLRLYLCNPSMCSTALDIIAGSTSTSEIALPASQTSYIRLVATPSASGASANIQIWLQYSTKPGQDGAVVRYPVNIVIR